AVLAGFLGSDSVLAGWVAGWVGEWTVRSLRNLNGRLTGRPEELAGDPSALESRLRWGVRLDLLRGALVTAALTTSETRGL
ncbi:MAG: hypothetical protein ABEJ46_03410, partial [Gemmatimonadota bacterium]